MVSCSEPDPGATFVVTREQVLAYRFAVQQLDRGQAADITDAAVLDIGLQDTGPDGAGWALTIRGVDPGTAAGHCSDLVFAWTLRGAPHAYRRSEIAQVAAATAPFSSADAAKRVFDAVRPLHAAGIDPNDALDTISELMRDIVRQPTVKGTVSAELSSRLEAPYLRQCRPCNAIHTYEQPFRLAALRAGLELQQGTSPPVLQRIPRWRGAAQRVAPRLDVIRAYLHLLGPATHKSVAAYLDAPVTDVKARWPTDVTSVSVDGERRWMLAGDVDMLAQASMDPATVRLLGPYDLFLQARDRELLVEDSDGASPYGRSSAARVRSSRVVRSSALGGPGRAANDSGSRRRWSAPLSNRRWTSRQNASRRTVVSTSPGTSTPADSSQSPPPADRPQSLRPSSASWPRLRS